jgi:transcription antitermination factor NusG
VQELQTLIEPKREPAREVINAGWHILRCMPNMELCVSIALNVRGYESFCPAEYRPQRTNRMENGRRVMESRARAMITGYDFIRFDAGKWDFEGVRRVKGVIDFMKIEGRPAGLMASEIDRLKALDAAAFERHSRDLARKAAEAAARAAGKSIPEVEFEAGKEVRVDGPTGEDWVGVMVRQRGNNRIEILRQNAKIIVPHSRIHMLDPSCCE